MFLSDFILKVVDYLYLVKKFIAVSELQLEKCFTKTSIDDMCASACDRWPEGEVRWSISVFDMKYMRSEKREVKLSCVVTTTRIVLQW